MESRFITATAEARHQKAAVTRMRFIMCMREMKLREEDVMSRYTISTRIPAIGKKDATWSM